MADTPFADTEALLALMRGEPEAAQDLIDEMFPAERRALHAAAEQLAGRSDDGNRCPGCGRYVEGVGMSVSRLGDGHQKWHPECRDGTVRDA